MDIRGNTLLARPNSVLSQANDYIGHAFPKDTLDNILHPLLVLDENAKICSFNQAYSSKCGSTEVSIVTESLYDVHQGQWNIPELHTLLYDVIVQGHHYAIVKVSSKFLGIDLKTIVFYARQIKRHDSTMILLSIEDATAYNEAV
ncbi:hypothetical protein CCAX7_26220 [Capsulimonas corticalis]|uniref:Uncharacterized protein n=2 Tax=Capsulimonas corticalis TaxID=2219043 RepID=A0A402D7B8_9BACT|nr:hypothetical protein CCAX7_26220 [Capsulimonas corticalis]